MRILIIGVSIRALLEFVFLMSHSLSAFFLNIIFKIFVSIAVLSIWLEL